MPQVIRDASDVTVAILTGHRPGLLQRTLESLPTWLWDDARFVVFHNGVDIETRKELEDWDFDVLIKGRNGSPLPIGPAASILLRHAAVVDTLYTLYLEDDWVFEPGSSNGTDWLINGLRVLADDPKVGIVRLRQVVEPVQPHNMVTGEVIHWRTPGNGYRLSRNAHYTCNPTLMRTVDLPWPAAGENDAQRKFEASNLWTAQLVPGVFRHIGGQNSLRRTMRDAARQSALDSR